MCIYFDVWFGFIPSKRNVEKKTSDLGALGAPSSFRICHILHCWAAHPSIEGLCRIDLKLVRGSVGLT